MSQRARPVEVSGAQSSINESISSDESVYSSLGYTVSARVGPRCGKVGGNASRVSWRFPPPFDVGARSANERDALLTAHQQVQGLANGLAVRWADAVRDAEPPLARKRERLDEPLIPPWMRARMRATGGRIPTEASHLGSRRRWRARIGEGTFSHASDPSIHVAHDGDRGQALEGSDAMSDVAGLGWLERWKLGW